MVLQNGHDRCAGRGHREREAVLGAPVELPQWLAFQVPRDVTSAPPSMIPVFALTAGLLAA